MVEICHGDVETRSLCDLKTHGTMRYVTHPSTIVLCFDLTWRGRRFMFNPAKNRKKALKLITEVHESGALFAAYNWTFEWAVMNHVCTRLYGWPEFPPERFTCSRALGLRWGLVGNLAGASGYIGKSRKDLEGNRIMLQLTKPRAARKGEDRDRVHWFDEPEKFERLQEYCRGDVVAEETIEDTCPPLSKFEQRVFRMDQRINTRGIAVDLELARGAESVFADYLEDVKRAVPGKAWAKYFTALTQTQKVRHYIQEDRGVEMPNMQEDTLLQLLALTRDKKLHRVLDAYLESRGQSINKYRSVIAHEVGGRLYFNLQYCGAPATGRWAGQNTQLQNMNRPTVKYDPRMIRAVQSGSYEKCKRVARKLELVNPDDDREITVADVLKSSMRSVLVPDENRLFSVNDYASIEARMVMVLSDCRTGVRLFETGQDSYKWLAGQIYDVPVEDVNGEQRFVGKQGVLGLGYGMGAPKFQWQCGKYGQYISMGLANKSKNTYRQRFREVPRCWQGLEIAFKKALTRKRTQWVEYHLIAYRYHDGNIQCRFPSGTILTYHSPKVARDGTILYHGKVGMMMMERSIWGGTLLENVCQGLSRDLMAGAMLRLEKRGVVVALTIHDELVCQVKRKANNDDIHDIILDTEKWARPFPIEVEGRILDRYRKI